MSKSIELVSKIFEGIPFFKHRNPLLAFKKHAALLNKPYTLSERIGDVFDLFKGGTINNQKYPGLFDYLLLPAYVLYGLVNCLSIVLEVLDKIRVPALLTVPCFLLVIFTALTLNLSIKLVKYTLSALTTIALLPIIGLLHLADADYRTEAIIEAPPVEATAQDIAPLPATPAPQPTAQHQPPVERLLSTEDARSLLVKLEQNPQAFSTEALETHLKTYRAKQMALCNQHLAQRDEAPHTQMQHRSRDSYGDACSLEVALLREYVDKKATIDKVLEKVNDILHDRDRKKSEAQAGSFVQIFQSVAGTQRPASSSSAFETNADDVSEDKASEKRL